MPDFEEGLLVLDTISSLWSKGKRVDVFQRCDCKLINIIVVCNKVICTGDNETDDESHIEMDDERGY